MDVTSLSCLWRYKSCVTGRVVLSDCPPVSGNRTHRWARQTPRAYFLLTARRDCLWKINQCFVAPLCFLLADTHHINKLKLLDARPFFWHAFFPAGTPKKNGQFFIMSTFDRTHSIFSDTKGWLYSAKHLRLSPRQILMSSSYFWGNGEATLSISRCSQSVYRHILGLQPLLFTSFTLPLCPKPLRYYTYQKPISNI